MRCFFAGCSRRQRPRGRRAAEQRDELAPSWVEHGLPRKIFREPVIQLTAPSGCRGSTGKVFGLDLRIIVLNRGACPGRSDRAQSWSACDRIYICSNTPTTFTEATSTYALGFKSGSAGSFFGPPADASPDGR